jgi:prolyl-tRNA editing enzyme YbaK/EbsC (Cys-tRNA(Pro) deacylase)
VERVAALLRAAGVVGQLEELPADADSAPGPAVRVAGFECDGRNLVALVPEERAIDQDKLGAAARCSSLRPGSVPEFPFQEARVFLDRVLLSTDTVWLEAGSTGYVLGLAPSDLARLTRAETADLVLEA